MSKNKITELPTYIGDMNDLKILKLDHNPIRFPPKEVWDTEDKGRDGWLPGLQMFLRQAHAERNQSAQETESGGSRYVQVGGLGGGVADMEEEEEPMGSWVTR